MSLNHCTRVKCTLNRTMLQYKKEIDFQPNLQETAIKPLEKKISEKIKKKAPWYSALYPTYKSRSEDFKRIFKDTPPEERLVVDYSCAIQRDILIHGRVYASQNFLCFYANIFRWETQVIVRWKDITSITKEKTALVIPNAILIHTENEKHFLTSFATRDKTYLMLLRIWQHALMDQPMSVQELWHWVHVCYGEELGLTSDDEDYVPPSLVDEKVSSKLTPEAFLEESAQGLSKGPEAKEMPVEPSHNMAAKIQLPPDSSDTSESDEDKRLSSADNGKSIGPTTCPVKHEGKMLLNEVLPLGIDDLFTLLFTYNKFNMDLMESMKYTDVNISNWEENSSTGQKMRIINLIVPMHQPVGPKTCQVNETQVMQACSKPGELYVIEVEAVNSGVPYCDSFFINTHYCLTRVSSSEANCTVHSQIKYRKSVWGLVKSFIEKNVWAGLDDFYKALGKSLEEECTRKQSENGVEVTRSQKRDSFKVTTSAPEPEPAPAAAKPSVITHPISSSINDMALWGILAVLVVLLLLNAVLFYKLSAMEQIDKESRLTSIIDSKLLGEERSHEEWVSLLQNQAAQHQNEIQQWKKTLKSIVYLLQQAEESISSLQTNIKSVVSEKVVAALKPLSVDHAARNNHNEL